LGSCCKRHDNALAIGEDWLEADNEFIDCARPEGFLGALYSGLVYTRRMGRRSNTTAEATCAPRKTPTPSLRVPKAQAKVPAVMVKVSSGVKSKKRSKAKTGRMLGRMPNQSLGASLGSSIGSNEFKILSQERDRILIQGKEVVVVAASTLQGSVFEFVGGHRLNPLFFDGTRTSRYAEIFEQFRFLKVGYRFITAASASTTGDVLISYTSDSAEPFRLASSANFVNRCLSTPGAQLTSVWKDTVGTIDVGVPDYKFIAIDDVSNPRDSTQGDIFMFAKTATSTFVGYLELYYVLELHKELFAFRPTLIGSSGDWSQCTLTVAANPTAGNGAYSACSITAALGTIVKLYVNGVTGATYGTGTTASNAFSVNAFSNTSGITMVDGIVIYGLFVSTSSINWFPTYETAKAASGASTGHNICTQVSNTTTTTLYAYLVICEGSDANNVVPV